MLDDFYYESSDGSKKIRFNKDGIYIKRNDVRDYEWAYSEVDTEIDFSKSIIDKRLPLVFGCDNYEETARKRDEVFYTFERDVKLNKMGKIWINGYYMNCYVMAAVNAGIIRKRFLETEFMLITDGQWHKESLYQFVKNNPSDSSLNGTDLPNDIPFDLGFGYSSNRRVVKNDCIVNSDYILTIYGPATNPIVEIAGHKYKVNGTIGETERVVIKNVSSEKRTIIKYAQDGTATDWFGRRYKEESIFEKIPEGNVTVYWDGTFGFDLELIDTRSEPVWFNEASITPEQPVPPEEQPEEPSEPSEPEWPDEPEEPDEPDTSDNYLKDYYGDYIVDSSGNRIEVA